MKNIETPGSSFIVKVKFFDWDGNYIKSFFIKESLRNIAFDDRTNTLIAQDNNNYLYKYKVKGPKQDQFLTLFVIILSYYLVYWNNRLIFATKE